MLKLTGGGDPRVYLRMGECYRELGAQNEALDALSQVIVNPASSQSPPLLASADLLRGGIYLDMARYREAVDDLDQAVAMDSSNPQGQYLLGKAGCGWWPRHPERVETRPGNEICKRP